MRDYASTISSLHQSRVAPDRSSLQCGLANASPFCLFGALLALAVMAGCASSSGPAHPSIHGGRHRAAAEPTQLPIGATPAVDLRNTSNLESLIPVLADKRVVLIGETHDRLDHHLVQLEIIRGLHEIHPALAIGMEAFQQPFQRHLDDYVSGKLSERELLRKTEYYRRWRFDFRLYQPILRYARENRLPLVALNLPTELTRKVGRQGIEGLSEEERAEIPEEIDRSDAAYESRLEEIFARHPQRSDQSFERFVEVQLLWDEGMAARAADYLESHPRHVMVILAGSGHLAYGSGIPRRLSRRTPVRTAIVLNDWEGELVPEIADFVLFPQRRDLPAAGRIGALLDEAQGGLEILTCTSGGACEKAGLKAGDRIVSIDGEPVGDMADLRLVMWDKRPGDEISLEIVRSRWLSGSRQLTRQVTLQ
jgi:uncharacterized iron-regulated protein